MMFFVNSSVYFKYAIITIFGVMTLFVLVTKRGLGILILSFKRGPVRTSHREKNKKDNIN